MTVQLRWWKLAVAVAALVLIGWITALNWQECRSDGHSARFCTSILL